MSRRDLYDNLTKSLLECSKERGIDISQDFARKAVHLFAQDSRIGFAKNDWNKFTKCKLNEFVMHILNAYTDPTNTSMINMKMVHYLNTSKEIQLDYVKKKFEEEYQTKLASILDDILRYPETCSPQQLDDLFVKMQLFVIVTYNLGSPTNKVLVKLVAQALNSVIGRRDLSNYVLKKKYHREEYLKRLAATVAGIVIFNNESPEGDSANVHNVPGDLAMAIVNTKVALEASLRRAAKMKEICQKIMRKSFEINPDEQIITYKCPIEKLHYLNHLVISFSLLERSVRIIQEKSEKTTYLINVDKRRFDCVIDKIHDVLKMRTAIDSELVFPHFVYLGTVWMTLYGYLHHLAELNRLHDKICGLLPKNMEKIRQNVSKDLNRINKTIKIPILKKFYERFKVANAATGVGNFLKLKNSDIKEFCSLTLVLTNGLLIPANLVRTLCSNSDIKFGFVDIKYAKYCERYFEDFLEPFYNTVFSNVNLMLLFGLEGEDHLNETKEEENVQQPKSKDFEMQTEMVIENDLSPSNWLNVTWNAWDFHRETIRLAEIRKCQTRDTQTKVSYGQRNAKNQAYNTRKHL